MGFIFNFFKTLFKNKRASETVEPSSSAPPAFEESSVPHQGIIAEEPVLAFEDGFLVMIVNHRFPNIPSWVEWDSERQVIAITQMNGDMDEAKISLKEEYYEQLAKENKILLVSNDNDQATVHFVSFIARR